MSKPRVLIIDNSVAVTGALKSITRTAFDLKSYFSFHFILPPGQTARNWLVQRGFNEIISMNLLEISKRISVLLYVPYLLKNGRTVSQIVRKQQIELIHVNDIYNLLPLAVRWFGCKVPYVCHVRFLPEKFPPLIFNFWLGIHLRLAEKIIVVSRHLLDQLPANPKIILIPNELPVEERYRRIMRPRLPQGPMTFLYLSNFIEGKGQNFAIEAFSRVHSQLPGWKLRFVGGDMGLSKNTKFRQKIMEAAVRLGIEKKIQWQGFTEDVEREYKEADIVLNFSESESFSITCLEALFYGRPLIATDCGGPAEIIDHRQTGLLVKNRDVAAMAESMLELANNAEFSNRLGQRGREVVKDRFSLENTSYRLREVYNFALKK
jgi:L-malate glycosyltransferase